MSKPVLSKDLFSILNRDDSRIGSLEKRLNTVYDDIPEGTDGSKFSIPSFNANRSSHQTSVTNLSTVIFNNDTGTNFWDTHGWYNTSNGRFTPLVAGKYRFSWVVYGNQTPPAPTNYWQTYVSKNGTSGSVTGLLSYGSAQSAVDATNGNHFPVSVGTALVLANGTTDYFMIHASHNLGGSAQIYGDSAGTTHFCGEFVSSA